MHGIVPETHTQALREYEAQLREEYREQLADERTREAAEQAIEQRLDARAVDLMLHESWLSGFVRR